MLIQITILDVVFSPDSVITAIGLTDHLVIMAIAIVLAVVVMLIAAKSIGILLMNTQPLKYSPYPF